MIFSSAAAFSLLASGGSSARRGCEQMCRRPLIPAGIGFVLGCCAAAAAVSTRGALLAGLGGLAAGLLLLLSAKRSTAALLAGIVLAGFGLGAARSGLANAQGHSSALALVQGGSRERAQEIVIGIVSSPLHTTDNGAWMFVDVSASCKESEPGAWTAAEPPARMVVLMPRGIGADARLGDRVRAKGELSLLPPIETGGGSAGWDAWLGEQGIVAHLRAAPDNDAVAISAPSGVSLCSAVPMAGDRLRAWCDARLHAALAPADAAVAAGILLGERSELSEEQVSSFAAAGCAHLLATAGLHVGILVIVLQAALRLLTVPRKLGAILTILAVWLYAFAAGDRAAVERAAFVATVYYAAILLERAPDLLTALALCAAAMLWIQPELIGDAGFQLSFGTVAGLAAVMPALMHGVESATARIGHAKLRWLARRVAEIELLAVAAQAVSAPIVAIHYHQVSCFGVMANLIVCPVMFFLMPALFAGLTLGAIWPATGTACLRLLAAPALHAIDGTIRWFAALPGCSMSVATPNAWMAALYYAALAAICAAAVSSYGKAGGEREAASAFVFSAGGAPGASGGAAAAGNGGLAVGGRQRRRR